MGPGCVWQTGNIKYPKLSRAMTMWPLYYHQQARPGHQSSKSGKPQYFSLSTPQPQVRGGALASSKPWHFNYKLVWPHVQRNCHYPGLDNLLMNKKVQTIVDIIGTDGKKKVKAA